MAAQPPRPDAPAAPAPDAAQTAMPRAAAAGSWRDLEPGVYDFCPICAWSGSLAPVEGNRREAQPCGGCRATLRYRNQAGSILTHLGRGRYAALRDLVRDETLLAEKTILEPARGGPFIPYFSRFRHYTRTYYSPDHPGGEMVDGLRNEDLRDLTFADACFDLLVTSDVMEHVLDYERAFAEIFRVLRPGGVHVMTVPVTWPMPEKTVRRAEMIDGRLVHHLEPRYHRAGDGTRSLYCTAFGFDVLDLLDGLGYEAWFERPSLMQRPGYFDTVLICKRPRDPA